MRQGFTLVEVLLALAIGAMAISGATLLLLGLSDRGRAIDTVARTLDHQMNAERLLRTIVRNLDLQPNATQSLKGGPGAAHFRSWCESPTGLPVRCSVRLVASPEELGWKLSLELRPENPDVQGQARVGESTVVDLWTRMRTVKLLYLIDPGAGGTWAEQWTETVLPRALGVVLDEDTLILPIRE
jgi:prepilin-type N-terminal cleavage/methylation domain-containing protein